MAIVAPQGRLTLVSGVAVMTADNVGATQIFYTPAAGNQFTEISNVLANSAVGNAGPAPVGPSLIYDLYNWDNAGVSTLTRGPPRASDTALPSVTYVNGVAFNTSAITNGPAALAGRWVGSFRTNASSALDMKFGSVAAGGGPAWVAIWNVDNRALAPVNVRDSSTSWTVGGSSPFTIRPLNGSTSNSISVLHGSDIDPVTVRNNIRLESGSTSDTYMLIALDGVSVAKTHTGSGMALNTVPEWKGMIGTGFHVLQAQEYASSLSAVAEGNGNQSFTAEVWW